MAKENTDKNSPQKDVVINKSTLREIKENKSTDKTINHSTDALSSESLRKHRFSNISEQENSVKKFTTQWASITEDFEITNSNFYTSTFQVDNDLFGPNLSKELDLQSKITELRRDLLVKSEEARTNKSNSDAKIAEFQKTLIELKEKE